MGVKTEVKNLNSFRHVQRALEFEIERHSAVLEAGGPLQQQTRLWDPSTGQTVLMRTKEEADDYRYFPSPICRRSCSTRRGSTRSVRLCPSCRRLDVGAWWRSITLPDYDAGVLTQSMALADYFERTAAAAGNAKAASNWIMVELARKMNESRTSIEDVPLTPDALAELIVLIDAGAITGPVAKVVFEKMYDSGTSARAIVEAEGLGRIDDASAIDGIVRDVLSAHPGPVAEYRAGKTKTLGFLVGQVMKVTAGKADPGKVNESVRRVLSDAAGDRRD